ncbi:MAG: hypothetical protein OEQ90_08555 [Gammaproteobacteria bacterium]|nr:hypothetical protein [Gammaproteobacteria bacterium]
MVARRAREKPVSGRAEREAARARAKKDIHAKAEEIILKWMPYVESASEDDSGHDKAILAVTKKIEQSFKVARYHQIAREYFESRVERFNKQHDRDLAIPIAPVRFRFSRLRRTSTWCQQRRALNEAHEQLLVALDSNRTPALSTDERLGLALYFAVTYGGLCKPRALLALRRALADGATIYADQATQLIWLDLYYSQKGACNEIVDGELRVCHRWLVPPACRLSLLAYLRSQRAEDTAETDVGEFALIKRAFEAVSGCALPTKSLKRFCSVGIAISERQEGANLSELEVSYAIGAIECMSLRRTNWELILASVNAGERNCG